MLVPQCSEPESKGLDGVHLAIQQPLVGLIETKRIVQFRFGELPSAAVVIEQSVRLLPGVHDECDVGPALNFVSDPETHPPQRRIVEGILPGFTTGPKFNLEHPRGDVPDRAQSKFRLGLADPALAGKK